jgi:hypothetical protein
VIGVAWLGGRNFRQRGILCGYMRLSKENGKNMYTSESSFERHEKPSWAKAYYLCHREMAYGRHKHNSRDIRNNGGGRHRQPAALDEKENDSGVNKTSGKT